MSCRLHIKQFKNIYVCSIFKYVFWINERFRNIKCSNLCILHIFSNNLQSDNLALLVINEIIIFRGHLFTSHSSIPEPLSSGYILCGASLGALVSSQLLKKQEGEWASINCLLIMFLGLVLNPP